MQLRAHIRNYRQFTSLRGIVVLHLEVDRRGKVLSAWVEQSSGIDALDNEALLQLHRANPLPPPPAAISGKVIAFSMEILFLDD
jgi:protein TonB